MGFTLTPANGVEYRECQKLIKQLKQRLGKTPKVLQGDKGYDVDQLRLQMSYKFRMGVATPTKKNRKNPSTAKPRDRYVVERTNAHIQSMRRLADCYEKSSLTRTAMLFAGFTLYWLKKILN